MLANKTFSIFTIAAIALLATVKAAPAAEAAASPANCVPCEQWPFCSIQCPWDHYCDFDWCSCTQTCKYGQIP
ncbi:hypothetical protein BGZ74_000574 [Mortierella antarctica]|nr:hypothetical protein BGZ74_000574 [Mortierella antarctica]KAG0345585.1 hypothetical protein BG005_001237 [Podila minutissima]